ncbi:hypothetical protein EMN47_04980 [Prolixibacteraceae bacterium JC049]|nr:hypothetical protein [Prolixibacteraceae bacterium JC049]
MKQLSILILLILFFGCNQAKKNVVNSKINFPEKFKEYTSLPNESETYFLLLKNIDATVKYPFKRVYVAVFSKEEKKVIFTDELRDAQVSWRDDENIHAKFSIAVQSINSEDNNTEYLYNVKHKRKKRLLSNL